MMEIFLSVDQACSLASVPAVSLDFSSSARPSDFAVAAWLPLLGASPPRRPLGALHAAHAHTSDPHARTTYSTVTMSQPVLFIAGDIGGTNCRLRLYLTQRTAEAARTGEQIDAGVGQKEGQRERREEKGS